MMRDGAPAEYAVKEVPVTPLPLPPFRFLFGALLTAGFAVLLALPSASRGDDPTRDQKIADIEKQIQELNRKLEDLKKSDTTPPRAEGVLPADWVSSLHWRPIGPAAMGGRIVALTVCESDPCTYWVATASGGLLKTINNGVTFDHQFDHESTVSIGDVCVAPSDHNIVWVGTGENNPRNSVSYGDGVYKSTDGGKTWQNMGLKKSFQIGRVVIHPKDPNIVYVGVLGRLYGPSEERGLYKTTDGGKTWNRILYVDDKTGVIDVQMHPTDPETLLVATWERQRDGYDSHRGEPPLVDGYDAYDPIKKWGPGSGIYKTTDGGKNFKKLTAGLPAVPMGRIGLDFYRKNPNEVFAIIDCEKIGMGTPPVYLGIQGEDAEGARLKEITPNGPAAKAELKPGDVVKAVDKKEVKSYEQFVEAFQDFHKAGDKLTLTVQRDKETKEIVVTLENRPEEERAGDLYLGILGEDAPGGVRLKQVVAEGPAEKAGLKVGDLVKSIEKKDVTTSPQLVEQLKGHKVGDKITLQIQREQETKEIVLTLEGRPRRPGQPNPNRPYSFQYGGQRENVQNQQGPDNFQYGGLYKSTDDGETWTRLNSINPRPMYFSQVRVDPTDDNHLYVLGISLYRSTNGGKTFKPDGGNGVHPDQHCLWIDPRDSRHMIVGCDGGFYATYDRMAHWDFLNHLAIGQFYCVAVDSRRPYHVYGGLQDNGSWGGPSHSLNNSGPVNDDWIVVSGGDGFVCRVDPMDPDIVYFESQDGNMGRRNLRTGEFGNCRPKDPKDQPPYRFNWNAPFILSSQNSHIVYCGGNYVFRSVKQGDDPKPISPEISRTKRGTATALAESPKNPDVLYAGTDDGNLWVTRDGGAKWTNVADKVGLPGPRWVASIEASRFEEGRAYVVFDGHRSDDDAPYVYVTEDFGQTWKSLRGNLPSEGSTRVLREDLENQNLLFLGTEFGAWASVDRGTTWTKINSNLPTVAVHEFALPTTANELVAATHGRSIWVLDITPLRQLSAEALKAKATLFKPAPAVFWRSEPTRGSPYGQGSRHYTGENPPRGAQLFYALTKKAEKASMKILDYNGHTVAQFTPATDPGLHRLEWDLRRQPPPNQPPPSPDQPPQRPTGRGGRGAPPPGPVSPGMYRVVLTVDGEDFAQGLSVEGDPLRPDGIIAEEEKEFEEDMEREKPKRRIDD
jgi:photosystem II stability/assembly factor-like uncharacterized protein